MKKTNLKEVAELIGIASIVASLIFVGMQLKQSQQIAIASQYHSRAELAIVNWGNLMSSEEAPAIFAPILEEAMPDVTPEERAYAYFSAVSFHTLVDNHLYQYQAGFLDEEAWRPRREQLKNVLLSREYMQFVCLRLEFRSSYKQLCAELIAEGNAESAKR